MPLDEAVLQHRVVGYVQNEDGERGWTWSSSRLAGT